MNFVLLNTRKKQFLYFYQNSHTKKGVGTLAYYSTVALDCLSCIISKAHTKIVYSLPHER